ncbi:hypothetical protein RSAG8_04329, partial [Rhizoctonia solani AG-8 WAC10335]
MASQVLCSSWATNNSGDQDMICLFVCASI